MTPAPDVDIEGLIAAHRELQACLGWALKSARELKVDLALNCNGQPRGENFELFTDCVHLMRDMEKVGAHASEINRGVVRLRDALQTTSTQ